MKKLVLIFLLLVYEHLSYAQCPTSGAIISNCTQANWTATGNVTVNSGVTVTITGTMTLNGGRTITGTGAVFNIGSFSETWGDGNSLLGGTYNVTGNFTSGNGSSFSMTGVTANINGNFELGQTSTQTVTNCTFNIQGTGFFGGGTHNIYNTALMLALSYPANTATQTVSFNGSAVLNLYDGSLLTLSGNVNAGNSARININDSEMSVTGNFDNAGSGRITVTNGGSFRVDGNYDNSGSGNTSVENGGVLEIGGNFNNSGGGSQLSVDGGAVVVGGNFSGNPPNIATGDTECGVGNGGCCGVGCALLPVSLLSFEAKRNRDEVVLTWQTASETNNDYFTIEKSYDGSFFSEAAVVPGNGTSDQISTYSWKDPNATQRLTYYRLKQTDYDGTFEFIGLLSVVPPHAAADFSVHPNPVNQGEQITVSGSFPSNTSWLIYDLSGHSILTGTFDSSFHILPKAIKPGIYMLVIETGHDTHSRRLVVR